MFACIFIPDFSAEAIIRFEPELRARCVAVLSGRSPLEKVVAVNERARQAGVEIGATRAQLEAWEELVLRTRSQPQEDSAHAALLDCAQSFSPEIEDTTPNTVLLNLAGLESVFGPVSKIACDLAHRISKMELEANVAVSANPDAALLAARGFSGVTLIAEGHEAERLGDLPVEVLLESFSSDPEEAARWLQTFDRWGVCQLRALASLPEIPLSERLGQPGIRLQKLARGAILRKLRWFEPPLVFAECVELESPIVLLEPLAFLLNRMLEHVCARLGARALAAQELRLQLELEPCAYERKQNASAAEQPNGQTRFTRRLPLPVPMLDVKMFLKLLQLDLQAHPPGAPIVKVHLSAEPARPRPTQSGLFLPPFPEPEKLELTLARIAGIVGQGRVGTVELLDTHREDAFEVRHFAPMGPETKQFGKRRKHGSMRVNGNGRQVEENTQEETNPVIALRLFRPALCAVITLREGKPVRLRCPQREDIAGEIVWTAGPWISSGDWSEQEGWSREEWDIAISAESNFVLYRLVQDKFNAKWFVEGTYD
jgi:protein ImuB